MCLQVFELVKYPDGSETWIDRKDPLDIELRCQVGHSDLDIRKWSGDTDEIAGSMIHYEIIPVDKVEEWKTKYPGASRVIVLPEIFDNVKDATAFAIKHGQAEQRAHPELTIEAHLNPEPYGIPMSRVPCAWMRRDGTTISNDPTFEIQTHCPTCGKEL